MIFKPFGALVSAYIINNAKGVRVMSNVRIKKIMLLDTFGMKFCWKIDKKQTAQLFSIMYCIFMREWCKSCLISMIIE